MDSDFHDVKGEQRIKRHVDVLQASTFLVLTIGGYCSLIGQGPEDAPAKVSSARHTPERVAPAREEAPEMDTNRHNAGGSAA